MRSALIYETEKTGGVLIVDKVTANPGVLGSESIPVQSDHIQICKPESETSPDSQLEGLQKRLELSRRIDAASVAKEDLNNRITKLKGGIEALHRAQNKRKLSAYTLVSKRTKDLLDQDLQEHSDFGEVEHVSFSFAEDWVAVNGGKNRAGSASGMVILKNSFALGCSQAR